MNVDYALVELLCKNDMMHILKNDTEYDFENKKLDSKQLTIYMKLAFIDNVEILDYLEHNLPKSFNDFEMFVLAKKINGMFHNSITLAIAKNNYKFIEILVKNFITRKEEIWDIINTVCNGHQFEIIFNKLINNNYLENIFNQNIKILIKSKSYDRYNEHKISSYIENLEIDSYFKYILDNDNKQSIIDTFIFIIYHKESIIPIHYKLTNIFDTYQQLYLDNDKTETFIIYQIIKIICSIQIREYNMKININNFKYVTKFIMNKCQVYANSTQLLDFIIEYINDIDNVKDKLLEIVKIVTDIIIDNIKINKVTHASRLLNNGKQHIIIGKLFGYNMYKCIQNDTNSSELIIKDLICHHYRRLKNNIKYDIKQSYLLKKGNLISYIDKYCDNAEVLLMKHEFSPNIKIDLITAAVITGDLAVIDYLNHIENKNFKIEFNNYEYYMCNCYICGTSSTTVLEIEKRGCSDESGEYVNLYAHCHNPYKRYHKSDYEITVNPFIKSEYRSNCECSRKLKSNKKINMKKTLMTSDIITDLMSSDIEIIKYNNYADDNFKLI